MPSLLKVERLDKAFKGVRAVNGVSFSISEHEVRAIIGPNGAGKTTVFNLISGLMQPDRGRVWFRGRDVTGWAPDRLVRVGLVRTFQITSIFPGISVKENVNLALRSLHGFNYATLRSARRVDNALQYETLELLESVALTQLATRSAAELSHGDQRVLEMTIGLAMKPLLLLLDEPTAGMSEGERMRMTDLITNARQQTTVVVIEHDLDVVMRVADKVTVLHQGRVLSEGTPDEIQRDKGVRAAYLGGEDA